MNKQLHNLLFVQGIAEAIGVDDKEKMRREAKALEVIAREMGKESPDLSSANALIECFTGKDAVGWMVEKGNEYHQAIVDTWVAVPKAERDKALEGVLKEMIKCGLFSISRPGFPILPAAIIAVLSNGDNGTKPITDEMKGNATESNFLYGIGQAMALWLCRRPTGKVVPWKLEELRGMYKDCVSGQIPEDI